MDVKDWLGADNQLGEDIWTRKYQYDNESFDEWLDRVSGGSPSVRKLIIEKKFLFGGRILANRGTGKTASLSNCYSRGFCEDSLDDLMQAAVDIAHTFKAQGGQGLSLSKVRPKGTGINGGQFKSDGIVPFMEIYNRVTESISQGGSRKGALLMSLDIWHKEAEEFIKIKSEEGRIQKANLSLEIDDDFMKDVKKFYETGEVVTRTIKREYNGNKVEYEVTPINLYKLMMQKAYDWGEPGCIFTNRFRNYNLMEYVDGYEIETCNPCGEQPLPKHGACNLGSINLSEFVNDPFTNKAHFDVDGFVKAVHICIKALDRIIDENYKNHALLEQADMALKYRNTGLGVMGLYDCLAKMNIEYGSTESITFTDSLMDVMFRSAVIASNNLAKEEGAFPGWTDGVLLSKILRNHFSSIADKQILDNIEKYGLRNCSLLSIAPSGSIATMLNVSTGCEPLFALSYQRKTESLNDGNDKYYTVYSGIVNEFFKATGKTQISDVFVTSHDVPWRARIGLQSILQRHVDTAISSTVNLKKNVSLEEVEKLYLYAWEKGLKGVTIFRDGCARTGILTTQPKDDDKQLPATTIDTLPRGYIVKTDDNCIGKKRTLQTGCGTLHVEAFFDPDDGRLLETYFSRGSSGGCANSYTGLSRMISLAARGGVDIYSIVDQLKSSNTCPSYAVRSATKHDTSKGSSCPVAIGNAIMDMYKEMQAEIGNADDDEKTIKSKEVISVVNATINSLTETVVVDNNNKCPVCGNVIIYTGGCRSCPSCGWSKCD